ncbi:MAG: efflux RND transporter permease subunit [Planctomycetes bacterium]|nr:efflux RND transporter permease subunit [Planctomycetota bacterium]
MKSLPRYSVENPVLVGVVMVTILAGGIYSAFTLVREMFPESRPNQVVIQAVYPGATPPEIEQNLAQRLEEAIKDVKDIEKIETRISEGVGTILVTLTNDVDDLDQKVNDFKAAVDAVPRDELPEQAEEVRVMRFEPTLPVIAVALFGDLDEAALKQAGQDLRDELLLLPGITDVVLGGTRKGELAVEVVPEKLVEYRLSLARVASAIRQTNLDLPGGQIRTPDQNVALRTLGQSDEAETIAATIVQTTPNGAVVRVSDLGRVFDGFEDREVRGRFNGKPAVEVTVYKTGDQDAIDISTKVKAFVAGKRRQPLESSFATRVQKLLGVRSEVERIHQRAWNDPYPEVLQTQVHSNLARYIEDRLDLLQRNGAWGLTLVFLSLLLFLNWRVAFWIMMGLLLSVAGAIMLMSAVGATLNLISMFGLIVVLGLIVDDAIVVGENIYARVEQGQTSKQAAIEGTQEVTWPVVIAVSTTIGAFLPLLFIEGRIGDFMGVLPVVVMCALTVSLIEALSILPSHLADWLKPVRADLGAAPARHWFARLVRSLREKQRYYFQERFTDVYERLLRLATRYRYVTVAAVLAALLVSFGMISGGRVPFVFLQKMDSETVLVNLDMPVGTPADGTEAALKAVENAILTLRDRGEVESVYTLVGAQIAAGEDGATVSRRPHVGQAIVELSTIDRRARSSEEIIADLRSQTRGILGVNSLRYSPMQGGPSGSEIAIEVTGPNIDDILAVAETLQTKLARMQGVYDITDDYEEGRREIQIALLDSARPLNLTTEMLATEVRGAFYGLEARTLQRDREDIDIRVRFPEHRRQRLCELESMRIATPTGQMVPFCEVARASEARGTASIRRIDQRRAVVVSADVDQAQGNADLILAELSPDVTELERQYPGLRVEFAGNRRETVKSFGSLKRDFVFAVLLIYVMLAGLFRSYVQPLVVLTAIPFGLNGAVAGHFLMGYPLTILSMIGLAALTGIVVNDALILVDFINREVAGGKATQAAVIDGGRRRLRPIILTSLTTILGLAPLMAETSFQARFLIPMAISISFGLAFATVLTLIVVPAIYLIVADARQLARRIWYGPHARLAPVG